MRDDGLRDHYLRALLLLRDMFEALAVDHVAEAPASIPFTVPVDVLLGWRTRAAALPLGLDEAANRAQGHVNEARDEVDRDELLDDAWALMSWNDDQLGSVTWRRRVREWGERYAEDEQPGARKPAGGECSCASS